MKEASSIGAGLMVRARASVRVTSDRVAYVEFEGEYRHVPRRLLYLRWWGDIVGSVTVTASVGDPIVYRRRRSVAVGIWLPPPNIVLRITYAVKLEPALPGDGRLSELKRNSLPAVQHASAPRSRRKGIAYPRDDLFPIRSITSGLSEVCSGSRPATTR